MALLMTALFLIVVVAGRVALQYQLTGDHGIRLLTNTSSGVAKFSSALIVIAIIGTIIISSLSALSVIEPQIQLGNYGKMIGVLFCVGGILLTSISQAQMGKEWRIGVDQNEKTELVTHGIYSKIRNPIYTGIIIFGTGSLVLVPHFAMFGFAISVLIAIELHVQKVEEPYLRKLHGQSFENYANTTGRYIPRSNWP